MYFNKLRKGTIFRQSWPDGPKAPSSWVPGVAQPPHTLVATPLRHSCVLSVPHFEGEV